MGKGKFSPLINVLRKNGVPFQLFLLTTLIGSMRDRHLHVLNVRQSPQFYRMVLHITRNEELTLRIDTLGARCVESHPQLKNYDLILTVTREDEDIPVLIAGADVEEKQITINEFVDKPSANEIVLFLQSLGEKCPSFTILCNYNYGGIDMSFRRKVDDAPAITPQRKRGRPPRQKIEEECDSVYETEEDLDETSDVVDRVIMKKSTLGWSGFANVAFKKSHFITNVDIREELTHEQVEQYREKKRKLTEYLFGTKTRVWRASSRYVEGMRDVGSFLNTCASGDTNNCRFVFSARTEKWRVIATRNIAVEEELLVAYNKPKQFSF